MAYPILGIPRPHFIDSSGDPLASGTVTIQTPAGVTKASYPTAADADANTNGTSADVTINSRGQPENDLWGKDNQVYRIIVKNSSGATQDDWTNLRMPGASRRTTVTFTGADATPTIAESENFITSGTTAITDFDDGVVGDVIHILAASTIAIVDGVSVGLLNSENFAMVSGDTLTMQMFNDQVWEEVGRSYTSLAIELTTTKTVTAGESGKTFFLNSATEFVTTLPTPALGLRYTFIVKGKAVGANYTLVTNGSNNIMDVFILDVTGDMVYAESQDGITFVDGGATGDKVEVFCDGNNWFCYGICGVDGKMTTTS